MKKAILLILVIFSIKANATNYYVATNGNDSNPGTIDKAWATLQKGVNSMSPGDILYVRGGTYYPTGTISHSMQCGVAIDGKKGSAGSMYSIFAYPGEKPVIDGRNLTSGSYVRIGILINSSDYWYIKGLEITRVDQYSGTGTWGGEGLFIRNGNFNKIESVTSHHNGGPGLGIRYDCEGNNFINCDAYSNFDPYSSKPGDNADGFDLGDVTARSGNERVNYMTGCRAWLNGDDGIDLYQHAGSNGIYYLTQCWAWKNGYRPDGSIGGDGNGFKLGLTRDAVDDVVRRYTKNCVSYANRQRGYSQESADVKMVFYNNIAYKNNLQGFSFIDYNLADVLRNNISYRNGSSDVFQSNQIIDHNSWQNHTVSDADFISLDDSQLTSARKSDGSLPDINFLHLAAGSDLIDAGVNVGLTYNGNAPDLGPFESGQTATVPTPAISYVEAEVKNSAPSIISVTFSKVLANITPSVSSFSATVNSTKTSVTTVSISGSSALLTLPSPIKYGDVVTFTYTKPSTNPLQSTDGAFPDNLSNKPVVNSVIAPVKPVYVSSVIENASPNQVVLSYDKDLANIVPALAAFIPKINRTTNQVTAVSISGNKVILTLPSALKSSDTITISYIKPLENPLQTAAAGIAETIMDQNVKNNILAVVTDIQPTFGDISITPKHVMDYVSILNFSPGAQIFNLDFYDFSGKLYKEIKIDKTTDLMKIPLQLSRGIYIVKLMQGSIVDYVQKIIVLEK